MEISECYDKGPLSILACRAVKTQRVAQLLAVYTPPRLDYRHCGHIMPK